MRLPQDASLHDETIRLRRWTYLDVDALVAGFGDPSVTRWFPVAVPFTPEAASRFKDSQQAVGEQ